MTLKSRLILTVAVVVAAVVSILLGFLADPPANVPSYALNSPLVWHAEVAAIMFLVAYFFVMATSLAWHGRGFTKLGGPGGVGIEASELAFVERSQEELRDSVRELRTAVEDLTGIIEG